MAVPGHPLGRGHANNSQKWRGPDDASALNALDQPGDTVQSAGPDQAACVSWHCSLTFEVLPLGSLLPPRTRDKWGLLLGFGTIVAKGGTGQRFVDAARFGDDNDLPPAAILLRLLAGSPVPLTATEIAATLRRDSTSVEHILDAHAAFVPVEDAWQLGRASVPPRRARAISAPNAGRNWTRIQPSPTGAPQSIHHQPQPLCRPQRIGPRVIGKAHAPTSLAQLPSGEVVSRWSYPIAPVD